MNRHHAKTTEGEDKWLSARLIPTSGIKGAKETEATD